MYTGRATLKTFYSPVSWRLESEDYTDGYTFSTGSDIIYKKYEL